MERIDRELEERVWQRIQGQPQAGPGDLRPLLLLAMEAEAACRQLPPGPTRERLVKNAAANAACLRGIGILGGEGGKRQSQAVPREPARKLIEKCYHRARHLTAEYTARELDGEFGVVYRQMADRERENCALLMELLGGLGR